MFGSIGQLGVSGALARHIILRAQGTALAGVGDYSKSTASASPGDATVQAATPAAAAAQPAPPPPPSFPQAETEAAQFDHFFTFFPDFPIKSSLKDKDVLDFGCGYGGKTVEYKMTAGARRVCGIEPFAHVIEKCQGYARSRNNDVEFKVCSNREIPYPDETFDFVLSHDVLEHVEDPRASIAEIKRVLRPGGMSFNIFPLYLGAASHHLDYVVKTWGLHWFFSPRTLVRAVNSVLKENPQLGMAQQPEPRLSFDGSRRVLPTLNGLSGRHLKTLFDGFEVVDLRRNALLWWRPRWGPFTTWITRSHLPSAIRDAATANVSVVLRKPG
jgi:SAM-dependent methyltransferase